MAFSPVGSPAQSIPPDAEWSTFETPHFRVSFTTGLDDVARRAGAFAEDAYALLEREFLAPPEGRIELLVADNVDLANGSASPVPRNRIVVFAHPPADDPFLSYHDDWLELLVLHELVHIFHLDEAGGVWALLRGIFGRDPLLFPQVFLPGWVVEGLATHIESAHTGAGRVRGSSFDMMLRTAVLEDEFFTIDRATFDPIRWPAANTRYVYGAHFIDFLARNFGARSLSAFVSSTGRQLVPFRSEAAARAATGATLTRSWEVWRDSVQQAATAVVARVEAGGRTHPEVLSSGGRLASYPRFSPDGSSVVYSAATGRAEPTLRAIATDGSERDEADISPISSIGPASWKASSGAILLGQWEFEGPFRIFSDLYEVTPGGEPRRLTRGARVWSPDLHPDGTRVVAVGSAPGTNVLKIFDRESEGWTVLTEPTPETYWAGPRWSPDGSTIAVGMWQRGNLDIVLLDSLGGVARRVTDDGAVDADPAWSPDGRYLLFSSDRSGIANLYAFDTVTGDLRQVTNVISGAFQPDVSPDGEWIAFSFYQADGYDIARVPYAPTSWRIAETPIEKYRRVVPPASVLDTTGWRVASYSAWPSVLPTSWGPAFRVGDDVGVGVGALTSGSDVVQRHVWNAHLMGFPSSGRVDGAGSYRYRGWGNPVLDLSLAQDWSVQRAARNATQTDPGTPAILRREREAEATVSLTRRQWRSLMWVDVGLDLSETDFRADEATETDESMDVSFPLEVGVGVSAGLSTARSFGVSLGPQQGFTASGRLESRRLLEDEISGDRTYWRGLSRLLAYRGFQMWGFAPSVLAVKVEGGVEATSFSPGFTLGGGGGSGTDDGATPLLRGGTRYGLRGYPTGSQGGNRVIATSIEYRFPGVLIERGYRLIPFAIDRLWGDIFADAGAAWCPGVCLLESGRVPAAPQPLVAIGVEATLEMRVGYFAEIPLRVGAAVPLREVESHRPRWYVSIGGSF